MSGELPKGWAWANLEELKANEPNSFTDGPFGSKLKTDHYVESGVRVIRLGNIGSASFSDNVKAYITRDHFEQLRKHEVFPGDLLIAALAEPVGRCCEVPSHLGEAIVKADCIRLNPSKAIDHRIILHWLNSPRGRQSAERLSHGLGRLRINMQDLRTLPVPVPPRAEQTRITKKIDALFARSRAAREELAHIPKLIERYRQAVLEAAFRGHLTADWRIKYEKPKFQYVSLESLCETITDGDHQAPPKASTGVPFITISSMNTGNINLESASRFVPESYYDDLKESRKPRLGDVLFSVTGSIAIPALVDFNEKFVFQRHIAIMKPRLDISNSKFITYMLASPQIKMQAFEVATGTAQLTISLSSLRRFHFPCPSMEEQDEIVRAIELKFSALHQVEGPWKNSSDLLSRLDQAILDKAFAGDLVPQDPNDEPASVLLERIKTARAAAPRPRRGRRAAVAE